MISISATMAEDLKLFYKSNHIDVYKLEVTTQSLNFKTLKFYYVGNFDRNINSRLEGHHLINQLRVGFVDLNLHSNHLQMRECYPHLEEGQYTPTQISSKILRLLFFDYLRMLCNFLGHQHYNCTPSTCIYTHQHMSN